MKALTWSERTAAKPRLEALRLEAEKVDGSEAHFCANRIWRQHFKPQLLGLIGWEGERAELRTQQAWDLAYRIIYGALPPCRDCACL